MTLAFDAFPMLHPSDVDKGYRTARRDGRVAAGTVQD
jgi:hypothetical protein